MISSAFKSAYVNQVNQQNQGINTITGGIKDLGTAVTGILGFSGALGSGTLAKAAKFGLANKIGGVGGALMVATMDEKTQPQESPLLSASDQEVQGAFDKMAAGAKTTADFESLTTVWEQISKARKKKREQDMLSQVESNLGGNV